MNPVDMVPFTVHVETVVLLRGEKVDSHIDVDLYDLPPFTPLGHSFMFLLQNVNFVPGSKCSKKKCSVSKTRVFVGSSRVMVGEYLP